MDAESPKKDGALDKLDNDNLSSVKVESTTTAPSAGAGAQAVTNETFRLDISGITVNFPMEPYDVQVSFMKKAIMAMQGEKNALLESPTGTGKTLCLLCSTLAWQATEMRHKKHAQTTKPMVQPKLEYSDGASKSDTSVNVDQKAEHSSDHPVIIYASRTHTQLAQVVEQLRKTHYAGKINVATLGSRDHLCTHSRIRKKASGTALNVLCGATSKTCPCKLKLDQKYLNKQTGQSTWLSSVGNPVLDIEELHDLGSRESVCSFYHTRYSVEEAHLVLMPYNYLFDHRMRKSLKIAWENSVVVFDEAHNLEDSACDAMSRELASSDFASIIEEMQTVLTAITSNSTSQDYTAYVHPKWKVPEKRVVMYTIEAVLALEAKIDAIHLHEDGPGNTPSRVFSDMWMVQTLEEVNLKLESAREIMITLKNSYEMIIAMQQSEQAGEEAAKNNEVLIGGGNKAALKLGEPKLTKFIDLLFLAWDAGGSPGDYKVFVCEPPKAPEKNKDQGSFARSFRGRNSAETPPKKAKKWKLNFWCFSPGVALIQLRNLGIRSLLLASGTLAPMASFKADLKVNFPIELENPHVIKDSQVWVGAVTKGVTGGTLNSTYKNRSENSYKDELGKSIVTLCMSMVGRGNGDSPKGPLVKGGVLVFFPTYAVMDDVMNRWKETNIWSKLKQAGGEIVVEKRAADAAQSKYKRGASSSSSTSGGVVNRNIFGGSAEKRNKNAYDRVPEERSENLGGMGLSGDSSGDLNRVIVEFERELDRNKRCVLLAVFRGKVSEGIDFTDERGRVVIVTGIPYAPTFDARVVLKRQYMDERHKGLLSGTGQASNIQKGPSSAALVYGNLGSTSGASTTSATLSWSTSMSLSSGVKAETAVEVKGRGNDEQSKSKADTIKTENKVQSSAPKRGKDADFVGQTMSGETWYAQSASRAVNQAIGRIIRHRYDWGAIFLMDDRFEKPNQYRQLSSWVRPRVQTFSDYRVCMQSFRSFLTDNGPAEPLEKEDVNSKAADIDLDEMFFAPQPKVNKVDFAKRDREKAAAKSTLGNKKVTVQVAKLPVLGPDEDDGLSFINPDLFMSQRESSSVVKPVVNRAKVAPVAHPNPIPIKTKQLSMSEALRLKKQENLVKVVEESAFTTVSGDSATSSSSSTFRLTTGETQAAKAAPKKPSILKKTSIAGAPASVFGLAGSMPWTSMEDAKPKKTKTVFASSTESRTGAIRQSKLNLSKKRSVGIKDEHGVVGKRPKPTSPSSDPFDIENFVMGGNRTQAGEGGGSTASKANTSVTCVICKEENPPDICAAKECGHLCCKVCWVNWLKMRKMCPLCKVPVSEESIRGITFK